VLARVRPDYDACFIVSNQGRLARGEIDEAEVLRRFAWLNDRLGGAVTDWRRCPHETRTATATASRVRGCSWTWPPPTA
jgi:hypothetical protein